MQEVWQTCRRSLTGTVKLPAGRVLRDEHVLRPGEILDEFEVSLAREFARGGNLAELGMRFVQRPQGGYPLDGFHGPLCQLRRRLLRRALRDRIRVPTVGENAIELDPNDLAPAWLPFIDMILRIGWVERVFGLDANVEGHQFAQFGTLRFLEAPFLPGDRHNRQQADQCQNARQQGDAIGCFHSLHLSSRRADPRTEPFVSPGTGCRTRLLTELGSPLHHHRLFPGSFFSLLTASARRTGSTPDSARVVASLVFISTTWMR